MAIELTVVGNVSRDLVRYGEGEARRFWGGAGLNISLAAAVSGANVRLISSVGRDARDLLKALGGRVEVSGVAVQQSDSCRFSIWYSTEGIVQRVECEAGAAVCATEAFEAAAWNSGHYHICCKRPLGVESVVSSLVLEGRPFSLDFIMSSAEEMMSRVREWIGLARYVFVNAREYEILQRVVEVCAIETLVVTAAGAPIAAFQKGVPVAHRMCPQKKFREVTGAGDVFVGAFLAHHLLGDDFEQSIDRAIALAQRSIEGVGASCIVDVDLARVIAVG